VRWEEPSGGSGRAATHARNGPEGPARAQSRARRGVERTLARPFTTVEDRTYLYTVLKYLRAKIIARAREEGGAAGGELPTICECLESNLFAREVGSRR